MKAIYKPLVLAAAVAAVTAGYAGMANAQGEPEPEPEPGTGIMRLSDNGLADMAIVPYYTTGGGFVTGVHIINTSNLTQVVKLRLRRGTDSMDALDFNLILSPFDEWTGWIDDDADVTVGPLTPHDDSSTITFNTSDASCTAPAWIGQQGFVDMPDLYREGAGEGYIEVIGMGSADSSQPISKMAKHVNGVPVDCDVVADNFFANNSLQDDSPGVPDLSRIGVIDSDRTNQRNRVTNAIESSDFDRTENVLKVSYFIRDAGTGVEFGNDAVHIASFDATPSITNQEFGIFSGDLQGFDFPDLNGRAPVGIPPREAYQALRAVLGGSSVINDWSANAAASVGTDWVVTVPGQYTMTNQLQYIASLFDPLITCTALNDCDHRDIPLLAGFVAWDREETGIIDLPGDLVPSPSIPGEIPTTLLDKEVNVIEWGVEPVLRSANPITVAVPDGAIFGWAELVVQPDSAFRTQEICDWNSISPGAPFIDPNDPVTCRNATGDAPLVGFVAWQRSFPSRPDANYGRIVEHSYGSSVE